ncbi:hypothetical protein HYFRA_00005085 [Hymenoscyphus fraxineus]|uniref:Short-chain dehydrogenase n=1 Tax=Hymenoscyphus fraxineus TaxID=746836 RepID=A0A9N9LCJ4_9HELO|nr:hypothetical protein HYFRA_00005085 [Hymenoscyphus fraxineus]
MASFNVDSTDIDVLNVFKKEVEVLITGPSQSGIGAQVAKSLASASPKLLVLAGRNEEKVAPVIQEIKAAHPSVDVVFVELDLLSNASIRNAVKKVQTITKNIDYLINNAGVMATRRFSLSEEGVESQFASNFLGPLLFTTLLLKESLVTSGDMILNVGSLGYQLDDVHFSDINYENGKMYNGWRAYGQAKSAQLLGTQALAKRLRGKGIPVLIAHPGVTLESKLFTNAAIDQEFFGEAYTIAIERNDGKPLPPQNTVSLKQAAGVILYTALNPKLRENSGVFIVENEIYNETQEYANNDADADKLWELSEKLLGEKFIV